MPKEKPKGAWTRILLVLVLISLPFLISAIYDAMVTPNPFAKLAGGLPGGRYNEFMRSLVRELNENSSINRSSIVPSGGSYESLDLLEQGKVDFALFQSGSDLTKDLSRQRKGISFVSNVFPETTHLVVRKDISEQQARKFKFSDIAIGTVSSGDYRVGMALISHFHPDPETIHVHTYEYENLPKAFQNSEIELAILTVGVGAKIIQSLIEQCECRLIPLPTRDAFLANHVAYFRGSIPHGTYFSKTEKVPAKDLETISVNAQLVTRENVSTSLVREVLKTLNQTSFMKRNQLRQLFVENISYATQQPEFPIHEGAKIYFDPQFRPILNPDFVEATEGIRSFLVSAIIGLFLLIRWIRFRTERSQAHKLDFFIRRLLDIEQEQMKLDRDYTPAQETKMEAFLDEITNLRRDALLEFTAHELKDDPAIECFISMSHALSEKINYKLTRDAIRKNSAHREETKG